MSSNVLKNFIHHANAHNKYLEEADMWKKRKEELDVKCSNEGSLKRSRSVSRDRNKHKKDKKMIESEICNTEQIGPSLKLFESDTKWDHSGYRELYPNDFENQVTTRKKSYRRDSSSSSSSSEISSSEKVKKSSKKKKSKKKKKKKKRKNE
jgi:hypothetical protein